jgi:serine/threonine-protein kinase RsbW
MSAKSSKPSFEDQSGVTIVLDEGAELPSRLEELEKKIRTCFCQNQYEIILDLAKIKLPPTRFIVILIEATSQARRMGGDVRLINLNSTVRINLVTFSPRTYLSIESTEEYAFSDFGETFNPSFEFDSSEKKNIPLSTGSEKFHEKIDLTPKSQLEDVSSDVAILEVARDRIRVNSKVANLYQICDFVLERAEKAGFDIRERGKIKVTVYEACLNVVEHAYFSNPENWIHVHVGYDYEKFIIIIQDWGASFEFDPSRPYDVEMAVKDRRTGGFGLHIIRRSVDEIRYLKDPKEGNRLILIKSINANRRG